MMQRDFKKNREWSLVSPMRPDKINIIRETRTLTMEGMLVNRDMKIEQAELSGVCWAVQELERIWNLNLKAENQDGEEGIENEENKDGEKKEKNMQVLVITDSKTVSDELQKFKVKKRRGLSYDGKLNHEQLKFLHSKGILVLFQPRERNQFADALVRAAKLMFSNERRMLDALKDCWTFYSPYVIQRSRVLCLPPLNYSREEVSSYRTLRARVVNSWLNCRAEFSHLFPDLFLSFLQDSFCDFVETKAIPCSAGSAVCIGRLLLEKLDLRTENLPRTLFGCLFLGFLTENDRALDLLCCMTIMVHNNYWETVRMDFENALSRTWSDIELDMFTSRLKTIESFHSSRFLKTSEPSTTQLPTGLFKVAQLVVNRIQKLRKKASLEPADVVEVYIKPSSDEDATTLKQAMSSEEQCIREAIGSPLLLADLMPSSAVILSEETFAGVFNVSFTISLTRPTLVFDDEALLRLYEGNANFQQGLMDYLRSRDPNKLKAEFHAGNGKIRVDCIKDQPPVDVVLGHHVFLSVGDHYLSTKSG